MLDQLILLGISRKERRIPKTVFYDNLKTNRKRFRVRSVQFTQRP